MSFGAVPHVLLETVTWRAPGQMPHDRIAVDLPDDRCGREGARGRVGPGPGGPVARPLRGAFFDGGGGGARKHEDWLTRL